MCVFIFYRNVVIKEEDIFCVITRDSQQFTERQMRMEQFRGQKKGLPPVLSKQQHWFWLFIARRPIFHRNCKNWNQQLECNICRTRKDRKKLPIKLLPIRDVLIWENSSSFYPDVMCMLATQCATGAEPPAKQSLYVLQHQTLGLWQTAQHKEEAKHSQASVQEKCT